MNFCNYTNCQFRTSDSFHSHIYSHIENDEFIECPYKFDCKKDCVYKYVNSLKSHIYREHANLNYTSEPIIVNTCENSNSVASKPIFQSSSTTESTENNIEETVTFKFTFPSSTTITM